MDREVRSLRIRLALALFVAAYGMVLILLAVVLASDEQVDVLQADGPDGAPVTSDVEVTESAIGLDGTDPFVLVTAAALAPVAAALAWWWSGRAVRPVARSLTLQRHLIEETSHELRTPLSVLTANAEVALGDPEPTLESYRAGLERSAVVAERMRRVLESLLVDARGRARTVDRRPTDVTRLVRSSVDSLRPLAEERGLRLDLVDDGPVRARVDPASVERAVTNLVANGLRHGPTGSVVTVRVGTGATGRERVEIDVTDEGPGIDPADQAAIFDRYWRAGLDDPASAVGDGPDERVAGPEARPEEDDATGSGLGLAIVRQVAVAHGGSVEVESPVVDGRGTRLRLVLLS